MFLLYLEGVLRLYQSWVIQTNVILSRKYVITNNKNGRDVMKNPLAIALGLVLKQHKSQYVVDQSLTIGDADKNIATNCAISPSSLRGLESGTYLISQNIANRLVVSGFYSLSYSRFMLFAGTLEVLGKEFKNQTDYSDRINRIVNSMDDHELTAILELSKGLGINESSRDMRNHIKTSGFFNKLHDYVSNNASGTKYQGHFIQNDDLKYTFTSQTLFKLLSSICLDSLNRLQLEASTQSVIDLISKVETVTAPNKLPNKLLYTKIDMTHIQGRYIEAVEMLDGVLSSSDENDVLSNDELSYLYMRKIHHQMMYFPVKPLIKKIIWLIDNRKTKEKEGLYTELLFMVGGNLGTLSGDFIHYRKILFDAAKIAREQNNVEMICRIYRKYADYLKERGHLKFALSVVDKAIELATNHKFERYLLYLRCTRADILSLQGDVEGAKSLFLYVQHTALVKNMFGWLGHAHLGLAKSYFTDGDIKQCEKQLLIADSYYQIVNQAWGKIQVIMLRTMIKKHHRDESWVDESQNCLRLAEYFGYNYEISFIKKLQSDIDFKHYSLMFL